MRAELPAPAGLAANHRIVKGALVLVGLLAFPVVALMLLQAGLFFACSTETVASGVVGSHIEWRISRMQCRNGKEPFYDVAVGAQDKTLVTALTTRGSPIPVSVVPVDESTIAVRLDRVREGTSDTEVRVRLRRSGSPRERIDLQSDGKARPAALK